MLEPAPDPASADHLRAPPAPSLGEALRFWLRLGLISFGGPAGQIALMHSELVERRRWISERRFLHALNYCMVLPGPEAQQLATYIGWLLHRGPGGILAGALFVLPSLAILIALSWIYQRWGQLPLLAGLFYGIKPAVAALVLQAAQRIGRRSLHSGSLWAVAGAAFLALQWLQLPFPVIVGAAALAGLAGSRWAPRHFGLAAGDAGKTRHWGPAVIDDETPRPPHAHASRLRLAAVLLAGLGLWAASMGLLLLALAPDAVLTQMAWFFSKAAVLSFGGAYAVLPYVVQGAVTQQHWLTAAQMMDGLALGESTPGPLIMVVAFVAYVGGWSRAILGPEALALGGALAAAVVTWFTFLPSFVFILAGGPLVEATHGRLALTAPLTAISAAVVGVILSLALFFCAHLFWPQGWGGGFDLGAALIAAGAALALMRFRLGVLPVLGVCALAGLAWRTGLG